MEALLNILYLEIFSEDTNFINTIVFILDF